MEKFILILKYCVVAIVQGVAEILPISSSGHMVIVSRLLNLQSEDLTFEVFLHLASLIALIIFFRKKLWRLITNFFTFVFKRKSLINVEEDMKEENPKEYYSSDYEAVKKDFILCLLIVLAIIPAGVVGLIFDNIIEEKMSTMLYVGILLIINSGLLAIASLNKGTKEMKDLNWKNALAIGAFQCAGIFPGISRSGSCIVGASTQKLNQSDAAEFAFLMGIPMFLGTSILKIKDIIEVLRDSSKVLPYLIAFIVTLVTTYFSLKIFLKIVRKQKLTGFSIYCAIVGILAIILYFVL